MSRGTGETITTPVTRHNWQVLGSPRFTSEPDGWLRQNLPLVAPQASENPNDQNTQDEEAAS